MKPLLYYSDYRAYLKDLVQDRRERGLPASNRWFALKMGINSNAWLTYILQGKRNLNRTAINELCKLLKLNASECRYFDALVQFNQSKSLDDRNRYYDILEAIRSSGSTRTLAGDQYEFYSVWYHSAIRSIIDLYPGFTSFDELGALVSPPITASETKKSVALLERLGLISKDGTGKYHISDKEIVSGPHEKTLAISNFQRETIKLAHEALDRFEKIDRDISTMTVGVSKKAFLSIQKVLQDARKRITEIASEDPDSDRVYHLNFQIFPFSRPLPIRKKGV
jgi:uncharacterized protein (TIGR02147 family)